MSQLPDISSADWLTRPETQHLLALLNGDGGVTRAVGGCVRDTVLGHATHDTEVDLATSLLPDEVMARLQAANVRVIPTGLEHGTVTALLRPDAATPWSYEITTLRRDVETDGRHAQVAFSDDWEADAARRDLTINALYADADGRLHDPLGLGLDDVAARRIRFIGEASQRIEEDYLRILRFYRFHFTLAANQALAADAVAACSQAAPHIAALSGERKQAELLKILALPEAAPAIGAMRAAGLLAPLFGAKSQQGYDVSRLEKLAAESDDAILRLASLFETAELAMQAAQTLRLANKQQARIAAALKPSVHIANSDIRAALYFDGVATLRDQAHLALADGGNDAAKADFWHQLLQQLEDYEKPVFPLNGTALKQAGIAEGPAMGALLKQLENWWVAHDFPPLAALQDELHAQLEKQSS